MRRRSSKTVQPRPAPATGPQNSYRIRIGMEIQRHRTQKGWTQFQLADRTGFSVKYIGQVERGEANQTVSVLEGIGGALEWDLMSTDPVEGIESFCQSSSSSWNGSAPESRLSKEARRR
jgi:transcriptional regulator with XRE-family HTH domain